MTTFARIQVGPSSAELIDNNQWKSDDSKLQYDLNFMQKSAYFKPENYQPNPAAYYAERFAQLLGGQVTYILKQEYDPDVIY